MCRRPFPAARTITRVVRPLALGIAATVTLALAQAANAAGGPMTEVVVALEAPSLAQAVRSSRALSPAVTGRRLDLASPTSRAYLAELGARQQAAIRWIRAAVPEARIRWRYAVVLDGFAVWLPARDVDLLAAVPGVAQVYAGGSFRTTLDRGPGLIGADDLWQDPLMPTRGEGMKIGVIDDGVDAEHPFFDPSGYAYPAGFPRGNREFTTPKVIVARAFAPPTTTWRYARLPFDPSQSEHGTHVAGIAAGNALPAPVQGRTVSGVAPRAYIGNYKALSTPSSFGLIDNAAEVVAAIEAAVRDGMDVINMSFGEFETDPARNPVDAAVDGAAAAGVVPVAAAGNSYDEFGRGSIGSPATSAGAIAVAATTKTGVVAGFSSSGPTALSWRLKPEVSAPGVAIFSSIPARLGSWSSFSGTSMASPHVAGAAALLRQRHPSWTVSDVAAALVLTGEAVQDDAGDDADALRAGGGVVDLPDADQPRVFARPYALPFGLLRPGARARREIELGDAGGGAGAWTVSVRLESPAGVRVTTPATVSVPARFSVEAAVETTAAEGEVTGFVVLERGGLARRIPLWLRVERPRLSRPAAALPSQGTYRGDTRNGRSAVSDYRYPDDPADGTGTAGPEQVFRIRVTDAPANLGVRVVSARPGVRVSPRIVHAGDENRLAGVPALPLDVNPYRDSYGDTRPVAAAIRPSRGAYDLVFDSASRAAAGAFTFRVWLNDTEPPRLRLLTPSLRSGADLTLSVADGGSGVDPGSLLVLVDGRRAPASIASGRVRVRLRGVAAPGRHRLAVTIADYQETKNSESVLGILPNTRVLRATFRVTR